MMTTMASRFIPHPVGWLWIVLYLFSTSTTATYSNYQYDMTVPQFTPDGRLLQVEYASAAADRSMPIVVIQQQQKELAGSKESSDQETLPRKMSSIMIVMAARRSQSLLERLVVLPESQCVVGLSGVLADSLTLLRLVQDESRDHRRQYGRGLTCAQIVATILANACQHHAFGGGLRPYGSTLIVAGFQKTTHPILWQTDPSGALLAPSSTVHVVGGSTALRTSLQRRLESEGLVMVQDSSLRETLRTLHLILMEELHRFDPSIASKQEQQSSPDVEVVVLSADRGLYKLTREQIRHVLHQNSATR